MKNDDIYPELESAEGALHQDLRNMHIPLRVDAYENRVPRSLDEMEKEAEWLKTFF